MTWIGTILFSAVGSLVAVILWDRFKSRSTSYDLDEKSLTILALSLRMLPKREREIYQEEWFMFLCDQEKAIDRFRHALNFILAAARISARVGILAPARSAITNIWNTAETKKPTKILPQKDGKFRVFLKNELLLELPRRPVLLKFNLPVSHSFAEVEKTQREILAEFRRNIEVTYSELAVFMDESTDRD